MRHKRSDSAPNAAAPGQLLCSGYGLLLLLLSGTSPALLLAQGTAKLAPGLQTPAARRAAQVVRVSVRDNAAFQQWARQYLPAVRVSQPSALPRTLQVAGLDAATLAQLAACPWVDFVDLPDRRAHEERRLNN